MELLIALLYICLQPPQLPLPACLASNPPLLSLLILRIFPSRIPYTLSGKWVLRMLSGRMALALTYLLPCALPR